MKRYIVHILIAFTFISCQKGEDYRTNTFPGFSGSGEEAIWVAYNHIVIDPTYLTGVLPTLTPPTTYAKFDSTIKASYRKEATQFSYKIFKNGEVAIIEKNQQNQPVWVKQANLKWENSEDQMKVFRKTGGIWDLIFTGIKDQEKLVIRFNRAFFGSTSIDRVKLVMDIYYVIFK